jgi:stearoyl-CoA desaturase (delta-9 desaturase)
MSVLPTPSTVAGNPVLEAVAKVDCQTVPIRKTPVDGSLVDESPVDKSPTEKGPMAAGPPQPNASPSRWSHGLDWPVVIWIALIHVAALAAPFVFTWKGLLVAVVLAWFTGGLGVCLGYHRLLTHASFATFAWVRRLLAVLGALSGEGPPTTWVAVHRKHHCFSDRDDDPHSPRDGVWWSHVLWLFPRPRNPQWRQMLEHYGGDLRKDPFMRFMEKSFLAWHFALGGLLLGAGWAFWDLRTGLSLLVYGMFVRLVYVLHITWAVNSASHIWGYRNYATADNSRNLWWVGLLGWGEGWHNNHHAFPCNARHGHRWWELDVTYAVIWVMKRCRLAWNVVK